MSDEALQAAAFLAEVYRRAGGNPANLVAMLEVGEELKLSPDATARVVRHLVAERLIVHRLTGGRYALTPAGRQRVEATRHERPAAPPGPRAVESRRKVFVSYSHLDARWKNKLVRHVDRRLHPSLDLWDDGRIDAGGDWLAEIRRAIAAAAVAVLLVSADYFASEFISTVEIPLLVAEEKARGLRIVPLILSASTFARSPLAHLQAFNPLSKPLGAMRRRHDWETVLANLAAAIESWVPPDAGDGGPPPGGGEESA